ncbi:hypothetical protein [Lysobacter gummosus]
MSWLSSITSMRMWLVPVSWRSTAIERPGSIGAVARVRSGGKQRILPERL